MCRFEPDAEDEPHSRVAYAYRGEMAVSRAADPLADETALSAPATGPCWPILRGDAVLTIREQGRSGPLVCRAGFHVDFSAADGVLRMATHDLDGGPARLPADAFVDLVPAARPPPPGTAGTGGMLGTAVDTLRLAGIVSDRASGANGKKSRQAFGGTRQPVAKFSFGEDDEEVKDAEVKVFFSRLHRLYVDTISNPFHDPNGELHGNASFARQVKRVCDAGLTS
mgnify:CR=1 FL=1